jgi:hypothetical protein
MRLEFHLIAVRMNMPPVLNRPLDSVRSGAHGRLGAICHLALLMAVAWPLGAQQGVLHEGRPALRYATSKGATTYVYHIDFNGESALRFSVLHAHRGDCAGYLYVTRTRIAYDPVFSPNYAQDGFNSPRGQLKEASVARQGYIKLYQPQRKFNFSALYDRGSRRYPGVGKAVRPLMALVRQAFSDFDGAVRAFQRETAGLQAPSAPVAAVQAAAHPAAAGPQVRIMDPAIADPTQPVEVAQSTVMLRGVARDPKGVVSVKVNGREAEIRSAGDISTVEFSLKDLAVGEGLNRVAVVATNVDRQTTQLEVLLWGHLPSAPAPTVPPTATPSPTPASPSPAQVATPTSTPTAPPTAGPAAPPAPADDSDSVPLHKDEILQMVQNGFPGEQIVDLVEESGIDFEPTEDYYKTLRKAGADDALISALRKAKRVKP